MPLIPCLLHIGPGFLFLEICPLAQAASSILAVEWAYPENADDVLRRSAARLSRQEA